MNQKYKIIFTLTSVTFLFISISYLFAGPSFGFDPNAKKEQQAYQQQQQQEQQRGGFGSPSYAGPELREPRPYAPQQSFFTDVRNNALGGALANGTIMTFASGGNPFAGAGGALTGGFAGAVLGAGQSSFGKYQQRQEFKEPVYQQPTRRTKDVYVPDQKDKNAERKYGIGGTEPEYYDEEAYVRRRQAEIREEEQKRKQWWN